MCEQCLVNPLMFGEVLPGWYLMRARRKSSMMEVGDWGLVRCNDPDFVWSTSPIPDPTFGLTDDQINSLPDGITKEFNLRCDKFEEELYVPAYIGYLLVEAGRKVGYNQEEHGAFAYWLFHYLGHHIMITEPDLSEQDPFPDLDKELPHDYSLGKY